MRVYVAERGYYYECKDIIGVFLSEAAALAACEKDTIGDYQEVEEFEIENPTEES